MNTGKHKEAKMQSAMEYLMTYGWAILVIAIVLALLDSLGVFSNVLAVTIPPGSCSVHRFQIGSTVETSLNGECNNGLPKFVAYMNANAAGIDMTSPSSQLYVHSRTTGMTISVWFYSMGTFGTSTQSKLVSTTDDLCGYTLWSAAPDSIQIGSVCGNSNPLSYTFQQYTWYNVIVTVNSGSNPTVTFYINGKPSVITDGYQLDAPTFTDLCIGGQTSATQPLCNTRNFLGYISNVQIYNESLDSGSAEALYDEGIGGVPVDPNHIVGWWPLNGDTQDYSGFNDEGTNNGVIFTSLWLGTYSGPSG